MLSNVISRCRCFGCSSFRWGAGAGHVDSVVAASNFILVLGLQPVDASSAVELSSQYFIGLTETIEFAAKVGVLALQAICVLLKSFSLSCEVSAVSLILVCGDAKTLNFTPDAEELVFLLFEAKLSIS